jgi:hypothetical protein
MVGSIVALEQILTFSCRKSAPDPLLVAPMRIDDPHSAGRHNLILIILKPLWIDHKPTYFMFYHAAARIHYWFE